MNGKSLRTLAVVAALIFTLCVPAWAAIVYRDAGPWGAGKGTTVTWSELDTNFYTHASLLDGTDAGVTLSAPTVADFTNSTHDHLGAAGGGLLSTLDAVESITFDTGAVVTVGTGELAWNDTSKTLDLGLPGGVVMQIGQELPLWVKNESGSAVDDGDMVYVAGSTGIHLVVGLTDASDHDTSHNIGMITTPGGIANNGFGYVTRFGAVRDLDTSAFSESDHLFLSATTPGAVVNTPPGSPHFTVEVGLVIADNPSQGVIGIDPKPELAADVAFTDNSDHYAPTQKAVKAYVDTSIATPTITDYTSATHDHADAAGGGNTLLVPTIASFANAAHDHADAAGGGNTLLVPTIASFANAAHDHADAAGGGNTLLVPTIASFANAAHDHADAAGGGAVLPLAVITFSSGDDTPSVAGGNVFKTAATHNITTFDDGTEGQKITLWIQGVGVDFKDGATLVLLGGADWNGGVQGDIIEFVYIDAVWYETSRSVN
jgi:hypothetical protein